LHYRFIREIVEDENMDRHNIRTNEYLTDIITNSIIDKFM